MDYFHFKEVLSTNITACDLLKNAQASLPYFVYADQQQNGVGTRGQHWQSPAGNVYATYMIAVMDECDISAFSLVVGLKIIEVFNELGYDFDLKLKWPNDIYCHNGKVAGTLITKQYVDGQPIISIGIGINFLLAPDLSHSSYHATALKDFYNDLPEISYFLRNLGEKILESLEIFTLRGFKCFREEWNKLAIFYNESIRFLKNDGSYIDGVFAGVSDNGAVVIRKNNKNQYFFSGKIAPQIPNSDNMCI